MAFRLITGAASYPVTLAEAKAQCRVDNDAEDASINGYIAAATAHVENYTGRAIMAQTWELTTDGWADEFALKGPVQSITSVKYYDVDGLEQTLSAGFYTLDETTDRVVMVSDFTSPVLRGEVNDIAIRFVAGYAAIEPEMKLAILLLIGLWYDNRAAASDRATIQLPHAVDALLANHRQFA
jgi:uncharacterized phiE125 gp8 family phage protein